jgi:rhomboid family GlyGly-CTERM serine protease
LLIAGATLLASTSRLAPLVEFSREAILHGELWRLFTGHLSHWSFDHLQWDLASFVLLGAIAERNGRTCFIALVAASALAISIGLLVAQPDLDFYRGLSGVDSALFVLVGTNAMRSSLCSRDRLGTALAITLLAGFICKIGLEATSGRPLFMADDPEAFLVWLAHGLGGAVGCLVAAKSSYPPPSDPHPFPGPLGPGGTPLLQARQAVISATYCAGGMFPNDERGRASCSPSSSFRSPPSPGRASRTSSCSNIRPEASH